MVDAPSISKERYLHEAQFALFACQMVEETLKSILMYAREVNASSPAEFVLIQKTNEELDELPLGKLIKLYERVSPSSNVTPNLQVLRPERNHCAHRALVLCFMSDVKETVSLQVELGRMESTRKLAWSCFESLKIEMQSAALRLEQA